MRLTNVQRLEVMQALRAEAVPDATVGRVIGRLTGKLMSRQRVGQILGSHDTNLPEKISDFTQFAAWLEEGKSLAWMARETGYGYQAVKAAALELGYTPLYLKQIRDLRWRAVVKTMLQQANAAGWPITETYIQRYDQENKHKGNPTTLCYQASAIQSFADWRRELRLDKQPLHQRLRLKHAHG
jgi:hypothetical protein